MFFVRSLPMVLTLLLFTNIASCVTVGPTNVSRPVTPGERSSRDALTILIQGRWTLDRERTLAHFLEEDNRDYHALTDKEKGELNNEFITKFELILEEGSWSASGSMPDGGMESGLGSYSVIGMENGALTLELLEKGKATDYLKLIPHRTDRLELIFMDRPDEELSHHLILQKHL